MSCNCTHQSKKFRCDLGLPPLQVTSSVLIHVINIPSGFYPSIPPPKRGGGGFSGFDQNAQCKLMSSFVWQGCGKPLFFLFFFWSVSSWWTTVSPHFQKVMFSMSFLIVNSFVLCGVFQTWKPLKLLRCAQICFSHGQSIFIIIIIPL